MQHRQTGNDYPYFCRWLYKVQSISRVLLILPVWVFQSNNFRSPKKQKLIVTALVILTIFLQQATLAPCCSKHFNQQFIFAKQGNKKLHIQF